MRSRRPCCRPRSTAACPTPTRRSGSPRVCSTPSPTGVAPVSDAFLYAAARTPFGRFGGALAEVRPDDLAATAITAVLAKAPGLDPAAIGDVVWGCANQAGEDNRNVGRMAVLLAGLPVSVPAVTVNRLCGSSLDAAMQASRTIEAGGASVGVSGGGGAVTPAPWGVPEPAERGPAGGGDPGAAA